MEPGSVVWVFLCCMMLLGHFVSIPCKRLVDNKYSRYIWRIWRDFIICLEISCSHPCLWKVRFEGSKNMDPWMFAIILFHHKFFFSREIFFSKGIYFLFIVVLHIFCILAKLNQGWDKIVWTWRRIFTNTYDAAWKMICASFICWGFFLTYVRSHALIYL